MCASAQRITSTVSKLLTLGADIAAKDKHVCKGDGVLTLNNAQEKREVPKGSLGKVAEIEKDGDASIEFEGLDWRQWVLNSNFGNISVLSQEDVRKERALPEELVAMLRWLCRRRPPITY
jgi:hypothetical protein